MADLTRKETGMQQKLWGNETKSKAIIEVDTSTLSISEYNPRKQRGTEYVQQLADRIKVNGYEITRAMWAYQEDGGYKVFAGGTRLRAANIVRLAKVPIVLHTGYSAEEIVHLADDDNENDEYHEPVGLVDMWQSYKALADKKWTQEKIARAKGCSRNFVSYRVRCAELPKTVLENVTKYFLREGQIRELLKLSQCDNFSPWLTRETALLYILGEVTRSTFTAQTFKAEVAKLNEAIETASEAIKRLPQEVLLPMLAKTKARTKRTTQKQIDILTTQIAEEKRRAEEEAQAKLDAAKRERIEAERKAREAKHRLLIESITSGQWWQLGEHLLYCGDTSKPEFYENLPQAALAFADPPYNVNAAKWDNNFNWMHDWLIDKADIVAVTPGISNIFDFARKTKMKYHWSVACWINNGMTRGALGFGNWIYTAIFSNLESIHRQKQDIFQVSILTSQTGETQHKGRKPAAYMDRIIEMFSDTDGWVIDPFVGSGSTLFACEHKDRRCICGEINPEFCKEIIFRWEVLTNLIAKKI